jgi:hypothetical protein
MMMLHIDHRAFTALDESALRAKMTTLERYAKELCTIGYDVTITSENGVDENDFELIIRKRPTA